MKNNKVLNFIMIPIIFFCVIGIFKKIFPGNKEIDGDLVTSNNTFHPIQRVSKLNNSFKLVIPEKDPFLSKTYVQNRPVSLINESIYLKQENPPVTKKGSVHWPKIEYLGFVAKEKNEKRYLLRIDGVLKRLSLMNKYKVVTLITVTKDSVEFQLSNGDRKFFKK